MRAKMSLVSAAFLALVITSPAESANYEGIVTHVAPLNGKVYVALGGGAFDGPASACQGNYGSSMVYSIDPNTPFGRSLVAVALSAKLSGLLVYAMGDGSCAWGNPFPGAMNEGMVGMDLKG